MQAVVGALEARCPRDAAELIVRHRAACVLQSFFRRSMWYLLVDHAECPLERLWPPQKGHVVRARPLRIVLPHMMRAILIQKRRRHTFRVQLMLRRRHFGDLPLLRVTHHSKVR